MLNSVDGRFAAYMQVEIQNDGPVTIQIDSPLQNKVCNLIERKWFWIYCEIVKQEFLNIVHTNSEQRSSRQHACPVVHKMKLSDITKVKTMTSQ